MDPDARICAVCGRVLEQWRKDDQVLYRHGPADSDGDHPPVAVRAEDAPGQVQYRCDFCFAEPTTHTLVVDKELSLQIANVVWDREWAMCAPCSDLVLADDWLNLRRRAFAAFVAAYGELSEGTREEMRLIHRDLRHSVVMIYQEA